MESALTEMSRLAGLMDLTKAVKEEAAVIYRKALEKDMVRGRSIDAMVAASLYLANQKLKTARSLDDFERHSRLKRKAITRAHKSMKANLKLRIAVSEPEEYVPRFCNLLGFATRDCSRYEEPVIGCTEENSLTARVQLVLLLRLFMLRQD